MPNQTINITGFHEGGLVTDQVGAGLPPNIITDCRNVRFHDNSVGKMRGHARAFDTILTDDGDADGTTITPLHVAYWNNPDQRYYTYHTDTEVFLIDASNSAVYNNITPAGEFSTSTAWTSNTFTGGFIYLVNNGIDAPHYIRGEPEYATPGRFTIEVTDSVNTGDTILFSFTGNPAGKDSNLNSIEVELIAQTVDSTVGRAIVATAILDAFVPVFGSGNVAKQSDDARIVVVDFDNHDFIAGTVQFTDEDSTGISLTVSNTTTGNAVSNLLSILPDWNVANGDLPQNISLAAGVIRPFRNILIAGDLKYTNASSTDIDVDISDTVSITVPGNGEYRLPGTVRISNGTAPNGIPGGWDPFADRVDFADEFELSDTGIVTEMASLQGNLFVFTNNSIHSIQPVPLSQGATRVNKVADGWGCLSSECVLEFDGKLFVVGSSDIYLFTGHPGNIQSIADSRVRDHFYENLNAEYPENVFLVRNIKEDEIWICYPDYDAIDGACNQALIWNYRSNVWTQRDLPNVYSATHGPIIGFRTGETEDMFTEDAPFYSDYDEDTEMYADTDGSSPHFTRFGDNSNPDYDIPFYSDHGGADDSREETRRRISTGSLLHFMYKDRADDEKVRWNPDTLNESVEFVIMGGEGYLYVCDVNYFFDGEPYDSYFERSNLPLGDLMKSTRQVEMYIVADANDTSDARGYALLDVRTDTDRASQDTINLTGITTKDGQFQIGTDYKVDIRPSENRYFSYRITNGEQKDWRVASISLEVGPSSRR